MKIHHFHENSWKCENFLIFREKCVLGQNDLPNHQYSLGISWFRARGRIPTRNREFRENLWFYGILRKSWKFKKIKEVHGISRILVKSASRVSGPAAAGACGQTRTQTRNGVSAHGSPAAQTAARRNPPPSQNTATHSMFQGVREGSRPPSLQ